MNKPIIINIEGTDCSGKETQANLLLKKLTEEGYKIKKFSFPDYDTPTGKIVGGPYLGKKHISEGYFKEGASNVDPLVASLYYAADRRYALTKLNAALKSSNNIILDRYVTSNMAHQGGKIFDKEKRMDLYKLLEKLEYSLLQIPKPDLNIFLHMPYEYALQLKKNREEASDQHEVCEEHLKNAETAYIEIAEMYNFETINCVKDNKIRSINDINEELVYKVKKKLYK